MRIEACALAMVAVAFAGCSGGGGSSALAGGATVDDAARMWASDAFLVQVFGIETDEPQTESEPDGQGESGLSAEDEAALVRVTRALVPFPDQKLGDGVLPAWGYFYYSPSTRTAWAAAVQAGSVTASAAIRLPDEAMSDLPRDTSAARAAWTVDSVDAIQALRNEDARVAPLLDALHNTTILYIVDFENGVWRIFLTGGGGFLSATVDLQTGAVVSLNVQASNLPNGPGNVPEPVERVLPDDIDETQAVLIGAVAAVPCGTAVVGLCFEYPFTAENQINYDASLTWGTTTNDFDLYLVDGQGNEIDFSTGSAPGNVESLSGTLEEGDYRFVVHTYLAVQESYHFVVTFS